jgi:hypothetical protein
MFQDFYTKAESSISTHIAAISSRLSRERYSVNTAKTNSRKSSPSGRSVSSGDQQMLSASEILDRRKSRHLLQLKKLTLEEAVERAVCERVYDRIWRHRSTDDEERDQKLRSRTAALSLIGIGLKELLSGAEEIPEDVRRTVVEEQDKIRIMLSGTRDSMQAMTNEHYPLAKLKHLTLAHKSLVETLSQLFPASSSADEILPTLIYALITSTPETINVISDLKFIQRFRASSKVDGEAAYCLVNLEASISFLETVDLSSLRADEVPSGPPKPNNGSNSPTPRMENATPLELGIAPAADPVLFTKPLPSPIKSERRLSHLVRTSATRLENASDSLRDAVLDSADQAIDTLNSTLENSFRFIFGRLREHQATSSQGLASTAVLPKTLEEAHKLVSSQPTGVSAAEVDDITSSVLGEDGGPTVAADDDPHIRRSTMLDVVGGRPRPRSRDHSVDSCSTSASAGAGTKRVSFIPSATPKSLDPTPSPTPVGTQTAGAVDTMRSFGNAINPLTQLSRMGGLFARSGSAPGTPAATTTTTSVTQTSFAEKGDVVAVVPGQAGEAVAVEELRAFLRRGVVRKFVECGDAGKVRIGEVEELLKEFQGLVRAAGRVVGGGL